VKRGRRAPRRAAPDLERTASDEQIAFRERLARLFRDSPLPREELLFNLGLYARSSLLVKFLVLHELYRRFARIPGLLVEFGTWWGQNLVLLENLRAIHEPFNKQRRIVGFDTFSGYRGFGAADRLQRAEGFYGSGSRAKAHLAALLEAHEGINALGHLRGRHELVAGDVGRTAPAWFRRHPEAVVAFAYFDIGLYRPTRAALRAIRPHLVPGSLLLLDEMTWEQTPGEAVAFKEVFGDLRWRMEKCALYPSKTIVEIA